MFGKKELENKIKELEKENQKLKQENQKLSESYGKSVSKQYLERIDTLNNRIEELNNDKNRFKEERDNAIPVWCYLIALLIGHSLGWC